MEAFITSIMVVKVVKDRKKMYPEEVKLDLMDGRGESQDLSSIYQVPEVGGGQMPRGVGEGKGMLQFSVGGGSGVGIREDITLYYCH